MNRPRDTQRSKVYSLHFGTGAETLSLAECEAVIVKAHEAYGIIWTGRIHHGGGTTSARGSSSYINLPIWARNRETVLHEATHAILDKRWYGQHAPHGPEFVRVWMNLLELNRIVSAADFRKAARLKKVKVSSDKKFDRLPTRAREELARIKAREKELALEQRALSARYAALRKEYLS